MCSSFYGFAKKDTGCIKQPVQIGVYKIRGLCEYIY